MRAALSWIGPIGLLGGFWLVAGPTALGGPASYVVVSGDSMEPTYAHGDLVLARRRDHYRVGDVITYRPDVGHDFPVIHRVVAVDGDRIVTRGDNRAEDDAWPVTSDDVIGASWLRIPRGGRALALAAHPAVLVAVATFILSSGGLRRRDRRERLRRVRARATALTEVDR